MRQKIEKLNTIYDAFAEKTETYRRESVCAKGCSFCCTEAGSIDITTLEGLAIREHIAMMNRSRQKSIKKALMLDIKKREAGGISSCPFILKNNACMIYNARPFICRRIYSLHACSKANPPMLNRRVMEQAENSLNALQELDDTGYSGHISFILFMLDTPRFFDTYLTGDFRPEEIMDFGKTHGIVINKMMTPGSEGNYP